MVRERAGVWGPGVWALALVVAVGSAVMAAPPEGGGDPDGEVGLRQLFTELVGQVQMGETAKAAARAGTLVLPESKAWFTEAFGAELGARLADGYARETEDLGAVLAAVVRKQVQGGRTEVRVRRLEGPGEEATGLQNDALKAMKRKTALYSVRLVKPGEASGFHLWSFARVGGQFRYLGKMAAVAGLR